MRSACANFAPDELRAAVAYAHARGVRVYVTCNIVPHPDEMAHLPQFLTDAAAAGADALIVSDLGVFRVARRVVPQMALHVSTQAGVTNAESARLFYELGARRIVPARELSLAELAVIRREIPADMEIEAFVHGAMCVSFSGRCLLSSYLTGRDSNRGDCAQPCRWRYALTEEKRPGQYFPIEEDDRGTYIMNARDLCMIDHIPELMAAGVTSFKIEGRAKSAYYVACTVNAYRMAIDAHQSSRVFHRLFLRRRARPVLRKRRVSPVVRSRGGRAALGGRRAGRGTAQPVFLRRNAGNRRARPPAGAAAGDGAVRWRRSADCIGQSRRDGTAHSVRAAGGTRRAAAARQTVNFFCT